MQQNCYRYVWCLLATLMVARATAQGAPSRFLTGVTVRATSEQVPGWIEASNLLNNEGLYEDPPGSGRWYVDRSVRGWNSHYGTPNDETPILQFDLQQPATVAGFHVWNVNAPGYTTRGFRDVTVQYSLDGRRWRTIAQPFRFGVGPGTDRYPGEVHYFHYPVRTRYLRLWCDSTWRGPFGQPDVAGLSKIRFLSGDRPAKVSSGNLTHPDDSGLINVRLPPYNAKGDGVADDTAAIQNAIDDWQATRRPIYLPDGVYRITAPLRFTLNRLFGDNHIRGQSRKKTILRLTDATFTDPARPRPVLDIGRRGDAMGRGISADWFANYVSDLTIDTGRNNPGAIALRYYSNNTGAVRRVTLRSGDGQGVMGLDLGTDQNGPHLIQHVRVEGFDTGILTAATVNSSILEHIELIGQRVVAFRNNGQCVSVRALHSVNAVPAVQSDYGFLTLIDAQMEGVCGALALPAVISGEYLFARNVVTTGYLHAIQNRYGGAPDVPGPGVDEYVSTGRVLQLFPGATRSLRLPVPETPPIPQDPPTLWANVRDFRDITAVQDDTDALQAAIDSGARTVYLPPQGLYVIRRDVFLRGWVRRLVAGQASIRFLNGARLRVAEGDAPVVFVEGYHGPLTNTSTRTLVFLDGGGEICATGPGDLFLENVVADLYLSSNRTWGRHVNAEKPGTKIVNNGSDLWILGLKTERGGALIATAHGGRSEVLGGLCYTTTGGSWAPMFINDESALSVSIGEVAYSRDPFTVLVRETRRGATHLLRRGEAPLRFEFMVGSAIPLYVGRPEPDFAPPIPAWLARGASGNLLPR